MPYRWLTDPAPVSAPRARLRQLRLEPYQALGRTGFRWFIGATAALIALPLLAALATPVFWGLLPFIAGALAAIWFALRRSWRDRSLREELEIGPDKARLRRIGPGQRLQEWQANSYWVSVRLYPQGGPVPDYLTLKGEGREVELGAFLTPEERKALAGEIRLALAELRCAP